MKTQTFHSRRSFVSWFFALTACCSVLPLSAQEAEIDPDKFLKTEALGKITLNQPADKLGAIVGKPEGKGKDVMWEAIGEWVQEWRFPKQGLMLNMSSEAKGGAKTVLSITATSPSKLATARGISIGSTEADVKKAYKDVQDKEQTVAGESFVAGSIYGGVIFTFKGGKVTQIFIGAAAE